MKLPHAESMNYWKTSRSSADSWLEKSEKLIVKFGGKVHSYAFGVDHNSGKRAYMFAFEIKGDFFKLVYPVLPSKSKNETAARRQAATLLYHHMKSKILDAHIFGHRTAFFNYLVLPDGRTPVELTDSELRSQFPLFSDAGRKMIEK